MVSTMRLTILACLAGVLVGCNAYDPNLPAVPFRCGSEEPVCPSGYRCEGGDCVEDIDGPDAPPPVFDARCSDLAEPNDMLNMATLTPVYADLEMIVLESASLCPATDRDYFRVTQPMACGAAPNPPCPNLDVLVAYTGAPPALVLQNATGATVQIGGMPNPPVPNTVKAVLNNVAQGQWYIVISTQQDQLVPNYRLTIDGTREF
jgi:hypothetical protein